MEKAEAREKERMKDEQRKQKKLEDSFKKMLKSKAEADEWSHETKWDDVKLQYENESAYKAVPLEADRVRLFHELVTQLEEACYHSQQTSSRKRKSKKHRSHRSRSRSVSTKIHIVTVHVSICVMKNAHHRHNA